MPSKFQNDWLPHIRWLVTETLALLALGCFIATIAAWSAIFIWHV